MLFKNTYIKELLDKSILLLNGISFKYLLMLFRFSFLALVIRFFLFSFRFKKVLQTQMFATLKHENNLILRASPLKMIQPHTDNKLPSLVFC